MKKLIIPISMLFVVGLSHAQVTNTENYVQTRVYLEPVTTSSSTAKQIQTVQYIDGLGRPKQIVNVKASPLGKDVVTHIEYDSFGRQVKDFLPVPQSGTMNGAIVPNPLANASQPSLYGSEKIYTEKILENSPLDRVFEQKQVGNAWNDKPVKFEYDANTVADAVKKYTTTTTWENGATKSVLIQTVNYGANQLYKNTVIDEDGNKTIEFKNGEGQTILLRKVISVSQNADTYYVYNKYNQLAFVIPPLATVEAVNQTVLDNLCYQYRYDGDGRPVEKKIPGKGWEYMVYDKADHLILSQDTILKGQGKWLITKYDQFGRVAYTGFLGSGGERAARQDEINNLVITESRNATGFTRNGMTVYYTDGYFVGEIPTILSVNYYDTYPAYSFNPAFPSTIYGKTILTDNAATIGKSTKSLPVMTLVKNIEDDNWTKGYSYYDTKGRPVGSYAINHLGGYTKTESELDFAGAVLQTKTYHKRLATDTEKVITETFTYDHQNRLLTHKHKIDNNPEEILAQNEYNELSQLKTKKVGGTNSATPLQSIDYAYNVRGWMTKINDPHSLGSDLFGYEMKYTNPANTSLSPAKYNGNIAEIDWKTSNDGVLRRYGYQYDSLNRLLKGIYQEPQSSVPQNNFYNEEQSYDLNGNIITLKRNSKNSAGMTEQIDDLNYSYAGNGNRLNSVTDTSGNYSGYPDVGGNLIDYDANGNMTSHLDKGIIGIGYNFLNLPKNITFNETYIVRISQGVNELRNVRTKYIYRADGTKLRKTHMAAFKNSTERTTITDYLDSFQYTANSTGAFSLNFVPTSEGYFNFQNNKYIYNYTDHLGNVRLSYMKNDSGLEAVEENNYYPFGLKHEGYNFLNGNNIYQYGYNNKELQTDTGMYDYGARFYMPDIGRWVVVDPLAEVNRAWSPYRYAYDNPIRFIDPDGRLEGDFISEDGTYLGNDGIDDKKVYVVKTTKTNFDSGAPSAGISNKAKKETEKFIEENSGNTEAFKKNNIAYNNSIEIESSATTRQGMVDIVNQDDGKGGTTPANNREYGGRIKKSGEVAEAPPGQITDPINDTKASIILTTYFPEQATFHSHPSGTKVTPDFDGKYKQAPSYKPGDIQNSNNTREYVFGRRNGTVYIFSNKGVQATIPQKYFVNPNKKK